MELSSLKIENFLIFSQKKFFFIPGNETFEVEKSDKQEVLISFL